MNIEPSTLKKEKKRESVCPRTGEVRAEGEEKSVVICGRGRGGSQACPKERKLRGPQFRSFSSSYPILSFSLSLSMSFFLHLQRKCSYERLISNRVYYDDRLVARSPGRGCACACARACCTPAERHTPLPLLGHLPSPFQSCGTRGRLVREIEHVQCYAQGPTGSVRQFRSSLEGNFENLGGLD